MSSYRPALALCLLAGCTAPPPELEVIRYQPPPPSPTCAGLLERPCYTGPPATAGVGRCRPGRERCTALGWTGRCEGEALPRGETCSSPDDDDCDGATTCRGAVLWARSIVGGGQDSGQVYGPELSAFALDARGRMWLAGGFAGQLDLNGLVLRSDSRPDQVEPYLARLDRDATHPVGRTFGRAVGKRDEHRVQDLHIAADGDLFLLLWTDGRVEFAGASAGGVQTPNVLAQLGPDGHPRRVLNLPLARHDLALRLALTDEHVVISGLRDNHGTILGPDDRGSFLLALDRPRLTRSWRRSLPANLEYVGITAIADELLLTGQFNATLAIANAELSCPAGHHCAALLRLDRAGEPRWHKRFGITGATTVAAVLADERGIHLAGTTQQIDLGGGVLGLPEGHCMYLAHLDPNGDHRWSTTARSGGRLGVTALAPGPAGAVFIAGDFSDGLKLDPFVLGSGRNTSSPTADFFVARYTATGAVDWAQAFGGPGFQELGALVHRPDDGALILAGMSSAEFTIGDTALPGRIFLAALAPDLAPETATKSP